MAVRDPIGTGLLTPFQRDGKGDFANGSGLDLLRSDIVELLGIRGPTPSQPGELPWDTKRGTSLFRLLHRHMYSEMTRALADQEISGALMRYEPRVRPGPVTVTPDGIDTLKVKVTYRPLSKLRGELQHASFEV